MRYNENNSGVFGDKIVVNNIDNDCIFEVSCCVMGSIECITIQANYDLIIYGDVSADSINVMGNFMCYGSCRVRELNVQGTCVVAETLETESGLFSDSIKVGELVVVDIEVRGNILCDSVVCEQQIRSSGKILVSEGMMGIGSIGCEIALCGEYATVAEDKNIFIVDEIKEKVSGQSKVQSPFENEDNFDVADLNDLDWEEYLEKIKIMAKSDLKYSGDVKVYEKLYYYTDLYKFSDLQQYIEVGFLLNTPTNLIGDSDMITVIREELFKKASSYVYELSLPSLSQKKFVELLFKISSMKENVSTDIYDYLLESIYNKIGMKYSTIKLMLGE